ncbi:MAG TPA: SH3 domain-containing protein [Egibacteraceae bacterium]|nr:SH3 domain-containing protein [Egibacteraceae bacterium]
MTAPVPTLERPRTAEQTSRRHPVRWWVIAAIAIITLAMSTVAVIIMSREEAPSGAADDATATQPEEPSPDQRTVPDAGVIFGEEPRANWDVVGVASGDALNVRTGPGVSNPVTATLAPDTIELESTGRIARVDGSLWREIVVPGATTGWVNARYLTEHSPVPDADS